jgi:hypothetical protein
MAVTTGAIARNEPTTVYLIMFIFIRGITLKRM